MEGTIQARFLEDFELDFVVSLIRLKAKNLISTVKKSYAQNIINDKNWPLLIKQRKKPNLNKELTDIKTSLGGIRSSIEFFIGFKSDPLFEGITGRLILLIQRVTNFIVEEEPENIMLQYSQFKFEALAECYELKTKLNKKVLVDGIKPHNTKSRILKEKQGFTSLFEENFQLVKRLGRGAYGHVFEVNHKYDKHQYAVKKVPLPIYPKCQEKTMREVQTLVQLQHKNIVRYYCSWVQPVKDMEEEDIDSQINQPSSSTTSETTSASAPKKRKSTCGSINVGLEKQHIDSNREEKEAPSPNEEIQDKEDKFEANDEVQIIRNKSVKRRLSKESIKKKPFSKRRKTPTKILYIQMELCKGGNLDEWFKKNKDRDYFSVIKIYLQILDAVAYIHSREVIHRDLKPGNIFFNEDNIIKVGDFGLALDIGTGYATRSGTASQRNHTRGVGTKLYMSPELYSGGDYDYKVDVYALGIIFFELLFHFSTGMERYKILTEIRDKDVYPDTFKDNYPEAYILIKNMLEKDPEKRHTVSEIRDALMLFYKNNNDSVF